MLWVGCGWCGVPCCFETKRIDCAPVNSSVLDEVCTSIGYTPTRYLVAWFAGRRLHVPLAPDEAHPLRWLLGRAAFVQLVRDFPGAALEVPADRADVRYQLERQIAEQIAAGVELPELAASVSLSLRRLQQIRADLIDRGWLTYAGRRPARGVAASGSPRLVDFSGTGDGSGGPPAPAA